MSDLNNCPYKCVDEMCVDCLRKIALREDHVSKKALREWCEKRISEWMPLVEHPAFSVKPEGVINEMNLILDQFCKEGES